MRQFTILLLTILLLASCSKPSDNADSSTLGGDPDLSQNTVGNTISTFVNLGGTYTDLNETIAVESNENGVITLDVKATLPASALLVQLLPSGFKDGSGNLDTKLVIKNTSEGVLDYNNSDGKPFVIVRYDSNVGDKYVLEKSNGDKITRTVTAKSTTDDYFYGVMLIKTVTVEQDSRIPGVSKIVYDANHMFGLVGIKFVMEDGSTTNISLFSAM
jgi:hypothetical protein